MKKFLVFGFEVGYSGGGMDDFLGSCYTEEESREFVKYHQEAMKKQALKGTVVEFFYQIYNVENRDLIEIG